MFTMYQMTVVCIILCLMTRIIMIPITAQPDTDTATYSRKRSDMDGVLLLKTKVGDVCGVSRWGAHDVVCVVWNVVCQVWSHCGTMTRHQITDIFLPQWWQVC